MDNKIDNLRSIDKKNIYGNFERGINSLDKTLLSDFIFFLQEQSKKLKETLNVYLPIKINNEIELLEKIFHGSLREFFHNVTTSFLYIRNYASSHNLFDGNKISREIFDNLSRRNILLESFFLDGKLYITDIESRDHINYQKNTINIFNPYKISINTYNNDQKIRNFNSLSDNPKNILLIYFILKYFMKVGPTDISQEQLKQELVRLKFNVDYLNSILDSLVEFGLLSNNDKEFKNYDITNKGCTYIELAFCNIHILYLFALDIKFPNDLFNEQTNQKYSLLQIHKKIGDNYWHNYNRAMAYTTIAMIKWLKFIYETIKSDCSGYNFERYYEIDFTSLPIIKDIERISNKKEIDGIIESYRKIKFSRPSLRSKSNSINQKLKRLDTIKDT